MARNRRIKSYKRIYQESNGPFSSPVGVVVMAVAIIAIAIAGWSLYGPVYDFIMGYGEREAEPPSSSDASNASVPPSSVIPEPSQPTPLQNNAVQSGKATQGISSLKAAYMPAQFALDLNRIDAFISALPQDEYDTIIVDLKDDNGTLYYKSQLEQAVAAEAIAPRSLDASAIAARIRGAGFRPAARINSFNDHIMSAYDRDCAVLYMNTDWTWLDNSPDLGGKPWLNPYSEKAQKYITDVSLELVSGGFDLIILDSLHFPTGVGLEKAGFGEAEVGTPRIEQLKLFAGNISDRIQNAGGRCAIYLPISAVLSPSNLVYGGNPFDISRGTYFVEMLPAAVPNGTVIGGTQIKDSIGTPESVVSALYAAVPSEDRANVVAWLQGYAQDGTTADASFIEEQISAVPDGGGYVVYNPQGAYKEVR